MNILNSGRFMWLEKICTALDLNGIDNVQPWLEKLTLAAKQTDSGTWFLKPNAERIKVILKITLKL